MRLLSAFACSSSLMLGVMAAVAPPTRSPAPRQMTLGQGTLHVGAAVTIAASGADDRFAASLLQQALGTIDNVQSQLGMAGARIVLLRAASEAGRAVLRRAALTLPAEAKEEGYALVVTPTQATVVADSAAGVFYGVQTLRQLFHPEGEKGAVAPAVTIVDWPSFRWRGVHHDLSRGPVATLSAMKRDIALLSEYKVNLYSPYFENTFAYQSLPLVGVAGGSVTAADARELVNFARQYHVTVVPEQEAFGHMHLSLQYEQFQDLVEVPYGNVLSPAAPASLDFIGKMFAELAAAFPGPFLHIGADETFELGEGRTKPMIDAQGEGPVYLNYLRQIDGVLQPYHRKVLFWGDIAVKHPELLKQLPPDMVAIAWEYNPAPSYVKLIKPFTDAGMETWVAPGVNNWNRIFPNYANAMANIKGFVDDGRKLGATGVLNTTWMDDGESLFNSTWYGLLYGAANSWQASVDDTQFKAAYDWALFRGDGHNFSDDIDRLTQIHELMKTAVHTDGEDYTVWLDPFSQRGQTFYRQMEPAAHQIRLLAEAVMSDVISNRGAARREPDLLDNVDFGARRFDYLGQKAIYAKLIADLYAGAQAPGVRPGQVYSTLNRINGINGLVEDLRDDTTDLRARYKTLWLAENRPYFLDNILARYDAELAYWSRERQALTEAQAQYGTTHSLPALGH